MKINNTASLNFTKTLYAKCNVRKNDKYHPCGIYRLDCKDDINYFQEMKNISDWKKNNYVSFVKEDLPFAIRSPETNVFVMEDGDKNCLAYCEITNFYDNISLDVLEVNPIYTNRNGNSRIKYIGETFLAFLASFALKNNKNKIEGTSEHNAYGFYTRKCCFVPKNVSNDDNFDVVLSNKHYTDLINKNRKHTNSNFFPDEI